MIDSLRRAFSDAESIRKNSPWWFWGVGVLITLGSTVVGGWFGFLQIPPGATRGKEYLYQALGGVSGGSLGLVGAYLLILFWNFLRAPYKRLGEANQHIAHLESELEKPKLFDVVCPNQSVSLPLNRLDDGSYRAPQAWAGFQGVIITNRGELTTVTSLTASPRIRFSRADNQGWETTNAIRVTPETDPLADAYAMAFTWDTSNPQLWELGGLPLVMAKDERLQLPRMMFYVTDAKEAGVHFENNETCTLIISLAIRTDRGNPALPDQIIELTRKNIRIGIPMGPEESNEEPTP